MFAQRWGFNQRFFFDLSNANHGIYVWMDDKRDINWGDLIHNNRVEKIGWFFRVSWMILAVIFSFGKFGDV